MSNELERSRKIYAEHRRKIIEAHPWYADYDDEVLKWQKFVDAREAAGNAFSLEDNRVNFSEIVEFANHVIRQADLMRLYELNSQYGDDENPPPDFWERNEILVAYYQMYFMKKGGPPAWNAMKLAHRFLIPMYLRGEIARFDEEEAIEAVSWMQRINFDGGV